ncbi:DUF6328 family protein [Aeromicrobium terrae]|uniref:Sodium:proton antiporter n=1 Tax=Aeromicrobium terrae TaxID=2498846 RepID=A0A5C8NKC9_9ACTN|nr:DUF6328 family protein [Aeromicrobium terrae]TXL60913.1 sodium:proton antiporter [Aeromicrobium terrae]
MEEHARDKGLDRNWNELLQELRVAQTGVQILSGFLLTLPFSPNFEDLPESRHDVYVAVLLSAISATLLLLSPVALHRALFHRGQRPFLVDAAHKLSRAGLVLLAVANVGAVWLIVDTVLSSTAASVAAAVLAGLTTLVWLVLPAWVLRRPRSTES